MTTFFHVHEVQELVEPHGIEAVALLAEATLESLQRLMELPSGTPVGVVGWGRTCMENLSRSIEGAGLDHLDFVQVYVDEGPEEVLAALGRVRAVVCASITAEEAPRARRSRRAWRSSKKTASWTRAASRCWAGCSANFPTFCQTRTDSAGCRRMDLLQPALSARFDEVEPSSEA